MAKTSILTILFQLAKKGNADAETISSLSKMKSVAATAGLALGALTAVGYGLNKVYQNTAKVFVNYAAKVRDVGRTSGLTAEESSKLIQVADDLTISYEVLQKSLWNANKNGFEVSIDSLAGMADEFVAIDAPAARADFLVKRFGKSGEEMGKLMEKGGDGVRNMTGAISGSLVLTEQAVRDAREFEIQLDELNDQWEALKVGLGQKAVPALNDFLYSLNNSKAVMEERNKVLAEGTTRNVAEANNIALLNLKMREYTQGLDSAGLSYRAWAEAVAGAEIEEAAAVQETFNQKMDYLSDIMGGDLTSAWDEYVEKIDQYKTELADAKTAEDKIGIQAKIDAETEAYNKRAASILFNIQQAAILAAVENGADAQQAADILTDLAFGYGLIDEKQKTATDSANGLVSAWASGELSSGALIAALDAQKKSYDTNADASSQAADTIMDDFSGITDKLVGSTRWIEHFNEEIWVAGTMQGTYNYKFVLTTIGSIPNLGGRGTEESMTNTGRGGHVVGFAAGGQMTTLGKEFAMVGEEGFEIITPSGYVIPHAESKALIASGLEPGMVFKMGGDLGGGTNTGGRKKPIGGSAGVHINIPSLSGVSAPTGTGTSTAGGDEVQSALETTADASHNVAAALDTVSSQNTQALNAMTQSNQDLLNEVVGLRQDIQKQGDITVRAVRENLQAVIT